MSISVKILKKSSNPLDSDSIITSFQLRYPRFVHAELMTHRVFSRNASSSRAVPVSKIINEVLNDPAMPVSWGKNQKGMQASEDLTQEDARRVQNMWLKAAQDAVFHARQMEASGAHKQIINRILEPFSHISVIVTATEWDNFYALRCHEAADPTMKALADAMFEEYCNTVPTPRHDHLPYTDDALLVGVSGVGLHDLMVQDAAMCARVSYLTHNGQTPSVESNVALGKMLLDQQHMSPFEHQASTPDPEKMDTGLWGNFTGWNQFRKEIE